jgi:TPR repeat protein
MVDASKTLPVPELTPGNVMDVEKAIDKREDLIKEATSLLKRNADRGHMPSQYFLADCYANGIGTHKNRQDFDRAFPLFILAAKHGHPDASYRAGTCCENGWGCRRESAKAIQFYRKAAASSHPGALYRLGLAELNGELGMSRRPKEGVKWLKRSAEHATAEFPHALHELALLHERGIHNVVFVDYEYSAELLAQAAELGYAPSAYRLGECYEYGKMGCPQDPALSIHYYNIAAQQNHRDACFALTAWYLVGSPGVLPQSDTEAFLWAKRAADAGLAKAMYAVGYFYEVAIGTPPNPRQASSMYEKAAKLGDTRATDRLNGIVAGRVDPDTIVQRDGGDDAVDMLRYKEKEGCVIM